MSESTTVRKTAVKEEPKAEPKVSERDKRIEAGQCVVDDGTVHVGRAVNGLVCSAHAMQYLADGTPRAR
jgi:hypothetical protein